MKFAGAPIPARPINGGRLELAPEKLGTWVYEPKLNGFRVVGVMEEHDCVLCNRHQEILSIREEFGPAMRQIMKLRKKLSKFTDTLDMEGLERRHQVAKGTLVILDYVPRLQDMMESTYERRRKNLESLGIRPMPLDPSEWEQDAVYLVMSHRPSLDFYKSLKTLNQKVGADFYEGVVAKEVTSTYPPSWNRDFPLWVKHRFVK
jgi:ATP-dependent DNA ligase